MDEEWKAPAVDRVDPGQVLDERRALQAWLDYHRQTLLQKCAGLTAAQLKERSVSPSRLTLLGLVRHMTDVERWWFRVHGGDEELSFRYYQVDEPDRDFEDVDAADAVSDLGAFRDEIEAADAAMQGKALDDQVPSHDPRHPERARDIRWLYLHMIEEYARHNGHADLLRERIDGATGY